MKWVGKIRHALAAVFTAAALRISPIEGRYEAGQQWSSRRSWLPGWVRDARFDADCATRTEILRKARYFERNNAIVNRLADLFEEYTVGPNGLRFVPSSSDPEWNAAAKRWWDDWCTKCDLSTLQTFGTIQSLCARSWAIDGEIFLLKTNGKIRENGQSFPRVQLIEAHRIETPPDQYANSRIIDGIEVDERGRPVAYHMREERFTGGVAEEFYRRIPAEEMIHIFEPSRPGQYRGLSMLYAVLNDLHDLDDLQLWNMDGAKDAAIVHRVIKTKTGEIDDDTFRRTRLRTDGSKGTSGGSAQVRDQYYADRFGSEVKVMKEGDEMQQFAVTRPSESERALWDYLTSKICAGFGISKLLVFPWSMQGTVTRADLDVAATFFRSRSSVLAAKFTEVWLYVIGWATRNDLDLSDPPKDWRRVSVRAPRSVNVDVGRNSNALIAEYEAGFRSLDGICGEMGEDWNDVLEQRAVELKKAMELEQKYALPEGSLIRKVLDTLKANSEQIRQKAEEEQQQMQEAA